MGFVVGEATLWRVSLREVSCSTDAPRSCTITDTVNSSRLTGKSKGKFDPRTDHEGLEGEQSCSSILSLISALTRGVWSKPCLDRFIPGNDPVAILQEAWWAPVSVWKGLEYLAPTTIRSPDPLDRS